MADEFFGKELQAASAELEQTLRTLRGAVKRDLADAQAVQQAGDTRERKATRRVSREEALDRSVRARSGTLRSFGSDLESERGLQTANRRLSVEERISRAKRQQSEFEVLANRRALPPAGGTGVGRGGLTPAEIAERSRRRLTTTGLFGAPPPPPRQPPPAQAYGPDDDPDYRRRIRAQREFAAEQLRGSGGAREFATAQRGVSAATTEAGYAAELAANRYRRHGALTTEFLDAARRGQVDIRELGYQVTATIGKFAGWTAAATLVYGVAAAMSQLGSGAVASLDGVNQLQRIIRTGFDTDQVQQDFRDLSTEFNLPIDQVASAAYEMSKIFGTQGLEATLQGTRAALFAVKVGELDAATATRYLSSIIQGAHLEASELGSVMDAVNQVTNKFGGNVGGLVQGVANATGAFTAAKGEVKDLIAFVETGVKVTGRSGSEIGTALRRTAEISQRPERRASIIQLLGVDPRDTSITDLLQRASEVIKKGGPDIRSAVLRAITTPELASGRILPILQNFDLYERVREQTTSAKSKGSSERELATLLKSPREELARFSNELQRMGSALASIGALDPFVLALTGANRLLHTATNVLEIFDSIPRPLRTAVALLAQGAAATALLRRFNAGSLPGVPSFFNRNPDKLSRATALSGLTGFQAETGEEIRRGSIQTLALSRQVDYLKSIGAETDDISAATKQYENSLQRQNFLLHQQASISKEIESVKKSGARAGAATVGTLRRDDPYARVQPGGGVPTGPLTPTQAARGTGFTPLAPVGAGGGGAAVLKELERQERLMQVRLSEYSVLGSGVGQVIDKGNQAVISARNSTVGLRGAVAGRVAAFRALGPEIAALDGVLIGAVVGFEVVMAALENANREDEIQSRIDRLSQTVVHPQDIRKRLRGMVEENVNAMTAVQDGFADALNFAFSSLPALDAIIPGPPVRAQTPHQDREAAARRAAEEAEAISGARRAGAAPGFFQRELLSRLRRRLAGAKTEAEQERLIARAEIDLGSSRQQIYGDASAGQRRALRIRGLAQISEIQRNLVTTSKGLDYQLDLLLNPKQVQEAVQARLTRLQRGFTGTGQLNRNLAGLAVRARELAATASPQDAATLLQTADQAEAAVLEGAKTQLDRSLDYARTPGAAARARQRYLGTAKGAQIGAYRRRIEALQEGIKKREDDIAGQADALDQAQGIGTRAGSPEAKRATEAGRNLKGLTAQQKEARSRIGELRRSLKEQRKAFNDLQREQDRAQFELELAFFDARTERLQSVSADPLAQASILVSRLRERTDKVMEAFRNHLATQADVDKAIAQQNQAFQQQAQQQLQRYQLTQGVATAQFAIGATDQQLLARQLQDAQAYLARAQSYGNRVSPEEVLNAQRAVYELQRQIAEQARQDAQALLEAQERLALAGADTELEQVNIRLRYFRKRQIVNPPRTPAERTGARADLAELNVQRRNARLSERLDQQQFLLDIGKITQEEYVSFLRNFLRTHQNLRKINRDLYRQIKRQLYGLTHDEGARESFELDVGNIRLPTVYDVRRALGGPAAARRANAAASVTNHNALTLYVARDADMAKVAQILDDYTSGGVKEAARAAGVIG